MYTPKSIPVHLLTLEIQHLIYSSSKIHLQHRCIRWSSRWKRKSVLQGDNRASGQVLTRSMFWGKTEKLEDCWNMSSIIIITFMVTIVSVAIVL